MNVKKLIDRVGIPRLIVVAFLIVLLIGAGIYHISLGLLITQCLSRVGICMILALAMVPSIKSGIGMNFGLPIGICCGLLAGVISLEYNMTGIAGIFAAILISIPISAITGYLYGLLLNRVKGSEMMVGTYMGFSVVYLMCLAWMLLPFKNSAIRWAMGSGLRTTITLEAWYDRALNNFASFTIGGVTVPTGLICFVLLMCLITHLFTQTRLGRSIEAAGSNPSFARLNGIDADRVRILGSVLTTVLAGIGIIVYAQGFGFYQLYAAPQMMAFPAVAAVLIGGADGQKISVSHVIIGTALFQSILAIASPVAGAIFPEGNLAEVFRLIISNGIILYALSRFEGGRV